MKVEVDQMLKRPTLDGHILSIYYASRYDVGDADTAGYTKMINSCSQMGRMVAFVSLDENIDKSSTPKATADLLNPHNVLTSLKVELKRLQHG